MSSVSETFRSDALDIFRGLAILLMVLSGVIPREILPDWMYHAQLPPPGHQFTPELAGLTWVDLVFPMFIFAMGAAMPFSLSKTVERPSGKWVAIRKILIRGFMLFSFAVLIQHFRPYVIDPAGSTESWLLGIGGFGVLMLIFTDWKRIISLFKSRLIQGTGWILAVAGFVFISYPNGSSFSLNRSDIIILILTNVAVIGGFFWVFTRRLLVWKVIMILLITATQLAHHEVIWFAEIVSLLTVDWLFRWDFLNYVIIAISGMLIGELIQSEQPENTDAFPETKVHLAWNSLLVVCSLVVFQTQSNLGQWFIGGFCVVMPGYIIFRHLRHQSLHLFEKVSLISSIFMLAGLFLQPLQSGIKKDPVTLAYLFVTAALCIALMQIIIVAVGKFKIKNIRRFFVANGRNPMIAYVAFGNLVLPLLALTSLNQGIQHLTSVPVTGTIRGIFYTILVGLVTQYCTSLKLYWKT